MKSINKLKKIFAMALAMLMMLAMSVPALADMDISEHTFAAYQIFAGTYDETTKKLSDIDWGTGVKENGFEYAGKTNAAEIAKELTEANANDFAAAAANKRADNPTVTGTGTIDLPAAGYYLIVDTTAVSGEDDARNFSLLEVNKAGSVTPRIKTDKPTLEKKVKDVNDSEKNSQTGWQDSADYDIGDTIPYKLTATMGDLTNFKTYKVKFTDTMTHLTLDTNTVKVLVGGESGTELTTDKYTKSWDEDSKTLTIVIEDVKSLGVEVQKGTKIVVLYNATLDADAVIGSTGNPNTAYLEYTNNPNNTGDGSLGKTPDDKNIVFTYQVTANKFHTVKGEREPLEGAKFTLYKKVPTGTANSETITVKGNEVPVIKVEEKEGAKDANGKKCIFNWKGLDDGAYVIVETQTPFGYNTADPIEFTITANHDETSDDPHLIKLDAGNLFTGDVSTGEFSISIENKSGTTLPSTGGIGTRIFYVVGGVLMAGAAILLIVKKRMSKEN